MCIFDCITCLPLNTHLWKTKHWILCGFENAFMKMSVVVVNKFIAGFYETREIKSQHKCSFGSCFRVICSLISTWNATHNLFHLHNVMHFWVKLENDVAWDFFSRSGVDRMVKSVSIMTDIWKVREIDDVRWQVVLEVTSYVLILNFEPQFYNSL